MAQLSLIKPPKPLPHAFIKLYQEFKGTVLSPDEQILSHAWSQQSLVGLEVAVKYQASLRKRYNNDIEKYNREFRESLDYFSMYCPQSPLWLRAYRPVEDLRAKFVRDFKRSLSSRYYMPAPIEGNYRMLITGRYTTDPEELSKALKQPVKHAADESSRPQGVG